MSSLCISYSLSLSLFSLSFSISLFTRNFFIYFFSFVFLSLHYAYSFPILLSFFLYISLFMILYSPSLTLFLSFSLFLFLFWHSAYCTYFSIPHSKFTKHFSRAKFLLVTPLFHITFLLPDVFGKLMKRKWISIKKEYGSDNAHVH